MSRPITPDEFRDTIGLFPTGVTVVTTVVDDEAHGMTANAFCSVSIDPLLVLVCVDLEAGLHDFLEASGVFAVTVLSRDQEEESVWFATSERPAGAEQFAKVAWRPASVTGSPVLEGGLAFLDCRVREIHAGGDHSIFVGEVVDLGAMGATEPLVWFGGDYRTLRPVGDHTRDD